MRAYFYFILLVFSPSSVAYDFKLALLHGESEVIFSYEISVLRLALANAEGEHTLDIVPQKQPNQARIFRILQQNNAPFNIFFSGFSPAREEQLLQVDFPISRGLLGHRIFIINKDSQEKMAAIGSLAEMKKGISIGSGIGWPDTEIFKYNGFEVSSSSYNNLWRMLEAKRFTAFNRGVHEAFIEITQRQPIHNNLIVDSSLMVVYPLDYFFYITPHRPELRDTVLQGLEKAFENGEFIENFNSHPQIKSMLKQLRPQGRRIFYLENPFLSKRVKEIPKKYWLQIE